MLLWDSLVLVCTLIGDLWALLSFGFVIDALIVFGLYKVAVHFLLPPPPTKKRAPVASKLSSSEFGQGKTIDCVNPATGEKFGSVNAFTREEVDAVVARAHAAQKEWGKTTFAERRAVLKDILAEVVRQQDEIKRYSVQDSGKTNMEALYGEILTTCEKLRYLIRNGEDALKPETRWPPLLLFLKKARVEYHPLGVIGIIVPWNYPFHNVASAVSAALFAGNGAVVKVSEYALGSKDFFEGIFRQVLARHGFSPDLVTLIPGEGETGAALVESTVDKILFIGSPQTGKRVMAGASKRLTPVILELGGKDPLIILDDAEFDQAVDVALRGVFVNCGQNCIAAERIYVHSKIHDKFVQTVSKKVQSFRQGAAIKGGCFDCGSMTMPRQVEIVEELVSDAVGRGATVAAGGKRKPDSADGALFYMPTVLTGVTHQMRIANEEAFGPVMLVIKFDSDEQVIEMANSTEYALGCSIFSTNYARAERIGREVVAGMCVINDFGISYLIQSLPFGGTKASGFGRFNGVEGLREFSRQKSVVSDRFPLRTQAPRFTQYPVPDNAAKIVTAAVNTLYGTGWPAKIQAAIDLAKASLAK
eukprot:TRINITY_DN981_c0_g1_i1.p1 TRINITY_DN981_c0_g1~~TRINITY_DN981_c0_g1_i1.p1  ORF type:complete len:589 (-),score=107.32 TRINITY_DN981_c0_g1_i1:31-1797(-)